MRRATRGWLATTAAAAVLLPLGLVGCGGQRAARWEPPAGSAGPAAAPAAAPSELAVTPEPGTTGALLSTEIGIRTDGEVTEVVLTAADGDRISGQIREDGTAWVPDRPLDPTTRYTATVTAAAGGQTSSAETEFTTMAAPGPRTGTGLYLFDGREYGVAMPVVVEFVPPVPPDARAEVQRRMFVRTDPPQPGVWHWVENGSQAFYRAPEHWQPGTELAVRIALAGHPTGGGRYGDIDRSATATIGDPVRLEIDNRSKTLSVFRDGKLSRTMPVSLGKPSTPSSSGQMVVMSRERQTIFDTFDELGPSEGYRVNIEYAMRLTWGGEFIHSAPWSVADQGVRNVSHGCVNLAPADARWLFDLAKIGDPVDVAGTEERLAPGNGWTAWDLSWEEFVAGSALPVPAWLLPVPVGDRHLSVYS
jgi:lipoprotein-anchoring transpeptidase ErfK/SrfK